MVKSDIRLINGDAALTVEGVKEYLSASGFKIDRSEITEISADIHASNIQRNVLKLYLSNSPQIVHWHIEQTSEGQVQIEVSGNLFPEFRIFYYACLSFLLIACGFFLASSSKTLFPFSFQTGAAISSLISAFIFYIKSVDSFPYEKLVNQFFEILSQKNSANEVTLQTGYGFPDLLKGFYLFIVSVPVFVLFSYRGFADFINFKPLFFFATGALVTIIILIILIFLMVSRPAIAVRVMFVLIGLGLCIPIIMLSNAPLELSFAGDMNHLFEIYYQIEDFQKYINQLPALYLAALVTILFIAGTFFICIIQIPVHIIKDSKHFNSKHPRSFYTQALQPVNFLYFDVIICLLWAIISIAIVLGLYFGFSVFEKTVFNKNFLFKSELSNLFFKNSKIAFMFLLQPRLGVTVVLFIHKMAMLIYVFPITMGFVLVVAKNIRSIRKDHSLLKNKSDNCFKIEDRLSKKVKAISRFAKIKMPIIKIVEFPYFNAKTIYLGFPIFNNVLIISKGILAELGTIDGELEAILAHEIWHMKKHIFIRKILCLLSDYTLFGNGFLAVLQNSYLMEKEADDFSARWLIAKYQDKNRAIDTLISLLKKLEKMSSASSGFKSFNALNFAMLKDDSYRDSLWQRYINSTILGRFKINLTLLYQMYFGEEILSYFHPPVSQRIGWVKKNLNQ